MLSTQHYKLFSILSNESPEKIEQLLSKMETESKTDPTFTQTVNNFNRKSLFKIYVTDLLKCSEIQTMRLFDLVKNTNSYISGSVLLGFEGSFVPNDLDIFTSDPQLVNKIASIFSTKSMVIPFGVDEQYVLATGNRDVENFKCTYMSLVSTGFTINVIEAGKTQYKALHNYFDIDICDKTFDGTEFTSRVNESTNSFNMTLFYRSVDNATVKTRDVVKYNKNVQVSSFKRAVKYMKRGYTLNTIVYINKIDSHALGVLVELCAVDKDAKYFKLVLEKVIESIGDYYEN